MSTRHAGAQLSVVAQIVSHAWARAGSSRGGACRYVDNDCGDDLGHFERGAVDKRGPPPAPGRAMTPTSWTPTTTMNTAMA
jgi:hypothetical protein